MAQRTEENAGTLEKTAASIEELVVSVRSTAVVAGEANDAVSAIKSEAEKSNAIVDRTGVAMEQIQASSISIATIVKIIDDIAFQTNLLALNAGVEAARAGDAGAGFAVVASEVRGLAARSAEAATEISEFINISQKQVEQGVSLKDNTGTALKSISGSISEIASQVEKIAGSAHEQSESVSKINTSTAELDRALQYNAAMFEETTAASQVLKSEAGNLTHVVAVFKAAKESNAPEISPAQFSGQDTSETWETFEADTSIKDRDTNIVNLSPKGATKQSEAVGGAVN